MKRSIVIKNAGGRMVFLHRPANSMPMKQQLAIAAEYLETVAPEEVGMSHSKGKSLHGWTIRIEEYR